MAATTPAPGAAALADGLLARRRAQADPANVAGMARSGISTRGTLGVTVAFSREPAREVRRRKLDPAVRHAAAERLWRSGVHEARILASMVDDPALASAARLAGHEAKSARWIASDVRRELEKPEVVARAATVKARRKARSR